MASGVFGIPITVQTVRATGLYKDPITQKMVAQQAMKAINNSDKEAQAYVNGLKERYGTGISAKCLIYNATGTTLDFVTYNDWVGYVYDEPHPFVIQNGQWGAYLHVHKRFGKGSAGAVVYRSKVPSGNSSCDWLFSWDIPWSYGTKNKVYTAIDEEGRFQKDWGSIYSTLDNSPRHSSDKRYGYCSEADIGQGTTVEARAIFQYENIDDEQ